MEYRVGQTLTDSKRKPTASFTVLRIREKEYADGNTAIRVKGLIVSGCDAARVGLREMDSRSLEKMFPHVIFEPERDPEDLYPEMK